MIQLKGELQGLKKKNMSVNEYVLKVKVLTDKLQSAGCPKIEEEILTYALGRLDENFDVFATTIEKMLSEVVTLDDVKYLLLIHESRLARSLKT